jgi:hypothetical protein
MRFTVNDQNVNQQQGAEHTNQNWPVPPFDGEIDFS